MATINLRIYRYKQGDDRPHYDTYPVECDANTTLLIALQDIRREHDASLMIRHSCHHASCGTCGMKVQGREELACVVRLLELGSSTITVEPLDNLPLISDLVVDMDDFFAVYNTPEMPYIRESEIASQTTPDGIDQFTRMENCIECGMCVSACPISGSDPAYLGPAAMAAAWRVVQEPRGHDPAPLLEWVDNEHGCWRCHVAFECSAVCPSDVDPARSIMMLRQKLLVAGLARLFSPGRG